MIRVKELFWKGVVEVHSWLELAYTNVKMLEGN